MIRADADYRFANNYVLADWLALGWHFVCPASHHSCVVVWLCSCKPVVPA